LATLLTVFVSLITAFLLFWGFQYSAPKIDALMGLDVRPRSQAELAEVTFWLAGQVAENGPLCERDAVGAVEAGSFRDIAKKTVPAYENLLAREGLYGGAIISPPKRVTFHIFMSYFHISGIYSPFTGEGNVNPSEIDAYLPFTMTHELAHRLGCAPEEDANFIAYLACMASDDPAMRFGGALGAFLYCIGQLNSDDTAAAWDIVWPHVSADFEARRVLRERRNLNRALEQAASTVSEAVNDTYLKTMGQQDGTQSYGRVTDLLLAYYEKAVSKP
jgi:hypothetical protein